MTCSLDLGEVDLDDYTKEDIHGVLVTSYATSHIHGRRDHTRCTIYVYVSGDPKSSAMGVVTSPLADNVF